MNADRIPCCVPHCRRTAGMGNAETSKPIRKTAAVKAAAVEEVIGV